MVERFAELLASKKCQTSDFLEIKLTHNITSNILKKSIRINIENYEFERDYFDQVVFDGKAIPCISLKGQKIFHSGYELRDKDRHDISVLESISK